MGCVLSREVSPSDLPGVRLDLLRKLLKYAQDKGGDVYIKHEVNDSSSKYKKIDWTVDAITHLILGSLHDDDCVISKQTEWYSSANGSPYIRGRLLTAAHCSFVEILKKSYHNKASQHPDFEGVNYEDSVGVMATLYVSCSGTMDFAKLIESIENYLENNNISETDTYLYFAPLVNSQWIPNSSTQIKGPSKYNLAIRNIMHTVVVYSPDFVTRSRCLSELITSVESNCRVGIAMSNEDSCKFLGSSDESEDQNFIMSIYDPFIKNLDFSKIFFHSNSDKVDLLRKMISPNSPDGNGVLFALKKCLIDIIEKRNYVSTCKSLRLIVLYSSQGNYARSIEECNKIKYNTHWHSRVVRACCLSSQGIYIKFTRDYKDSAKSFESADEIFHTFDNDEAFKSLSKQIQLFVYDKRALNLYRKGDYKGAEEIYSKFSISELSDDILINRANNYSKQGEYDKAGMILRSIYYLRKKKFSEFHPDTLSVMHLYANNFHNKLNYDKASFMLEQCLKFRESALSEYNPDTLMTMNSLAVNFSKNGEFRLAKEFFEKCIEKRREVLGEYHYDTLSSLNNLASHYCTFGAVWLPAVVMDSSIVDKTYKLRYANELEFKNDCSVPEKNIRTAAKQANIDDSLKSFSAVFSNSSGSKKFTVGRKVESNYHGFAKYNEAIRLHKECLEKQKKVIGENHPSFINTLNNLARCYTMRAAAGDFEKAEETYKLCLIKQKDILGDPLHQDVLSTMNNLAVNYMKQGKFKEAKELFFQVEGFLLERKEATGASYPISPDVKYNSDLNQFLKLYSEDHNNASHASVANEHKGLTKSIFYEENWAKRLCKINV